jgi:hypothetical protein
MISSVTYVWNHPLPQACSEILVVALVVVVAAVIVVMLEVIVLLMVIGVQVVAVARV